MITTQPLTASERIMQSELDAAITVYRKTHPQLDSASQYIFEAGVRAGFVRGCARAPELSMKHHNG